MQSISDLLARKAQIDRDNRDHAGCGSASYDTWLVDAIEALLRVALSRLPALPPERRERERSPP